MDVTNVADQAWRCRQGGTGGRKEGGRTVMVEEDRAVFLVDMDRGGGMDATPGHAVFDGLHGDAAFPPAVLGVVGFHLRREGGREGGRGLGMRPCL